MPKKTAITILEEGADYILGLKDNQPTLYREAIERLSGLPPSWTSGLEKHHGRIEERDLRVVDLEATISPFPGAVRFVAMTRRHQATGDKVPREAAESEKVITETRYFLTSLHTDQADDRKLALLIRNHWSIENKNHYKRDYSHWFEDRSTRRKPAGARNLSLLRGACLALIPPEAYTSLNSALDDHNNYKGKALKRITSPPPREP